MAEQIIQDNNFDKEIIEDLEQIHDDTKLLKKQESNKKYYIKFGEQHRQKMNTYYHEIAKEQKYYCNYCNCYVLHCAYRNHCLCKKHIKYVDNTIEDKPIIVNLPQNI